MIERNWENTFTKHEQCDSHRNKESSLETEIKMDERFVYISVLRLNLRIKKIKFVKWNEEKIILIEYIFKYKYTSLLSKGVQIVDCY